MEITNYVDALYSTSELHLQKLMGKAGKPALKHKTTLGVEISGVKKTKPSTRNLIAKIPVSEEVVDPDDEYGVSGIESRAARALRLTNVKHTSDIVVDKALIRKANLQHIFEVPTALDLADMSANIDALNLFDPAAPDQDSLAFREFETAIGKTLADTAGGKQAAAAANYAFTPAAQTLLSDPKIAAIFTDTAAVLSKYRAGTLPKILKCVPSSSVWEAALEITRPLEWSPQATVAITRLFISQLNEDEAYRFLKSILLPRVMLAMEKERKLNVHLFQALGKSTYKPRAFYRGIVFVLARRDASTNIVKAVSSILKRCSIPADIAAPAIFKLSQMEWNPAVAAFLGSLLDKAYSLPVGVVESVVQHYEKASLVSNTMQLPLVFHASLLIFVKRYAKAMAGEQQVRLLKVVKRCPHEGGISTEIIKVFKDSSAGFSSNGHTYGENDIII